MLKLIFRTSFVFFFFISSLTLEAAEKIRSYEVNVNPMRMNQIALNFEVVKKLSNGFEVYVKEADVEIFLRLAPQAKLLLKNIQSEYKSVENDKLLEVAKYRKFEDVERDLQAFVSKYKDLATLETYGLSGEGRKLYALKISTSKNENIPLKNKPQVMITAATHGDELITVEVLFSLLNELLEGYGKDSRLSKILEGRDLYFIPVVSPDSFEARERYVLGVDPNRSFPWPLNENNKSVDCIQSLMKFTNAHQFMGSLDLHAYGKLVMFPWAYKSTPPEDKDEVLMKDLVQSMARENKYKAGQISTTIYVAKGSSADYFYWKKQTQAIAVELSNQKVPAYNTIPKVVDEAREMVWTFLEHFN